MSLSRRLRLAAFSLGLALPGIAVAAEPVFPPGSSIGIVPPRGMAPSARFKGFEGPGGSSVVLTEMPVAAMPEVTAGFTLEGRSKWEATRLLRRCHRPSEGSQAGSGRPPWRMRPRRRGRVRGAAGRRSAAGREPPRR